MPSLEPEQVVYSIVIIGNFNPAIFHPSWFSANNLLPKEETEQATDLAISNELAMFNASEIQVQIEPVRFGVTTKDANKSPVLRDLAMGCFLLLEHTPLKAIGLNMEFQFDLESIEKRTAIGERLAPKNHWTSVLENPEMRAILVQGERNDCSAEKITIRVQPSRPDNCVLVGFNQHYTLAKTDQESVRSRIAEAVRILRDDWHSFGSYAKSAALHVITGNLEDKS